MPKIDFKQLIAEIRKIGLKVTPARLAILHVLQSHHEPQTINQIKKRLGQAQIDLVTVYRNVEQLEKLRVIKKVLLDDDEAYFEYNIKHHHHLICQNCNQIEDIEINDHTWIEKKLKEKKFTVLDHTFEFFGLCSQCQ